MNSGVQDSVNLVWKIDLAPKGLADDALLDAYEIERKPVAEFNGAQSLENTRRMEETGWLLFNPARHQGRAFRSAPMSAHLSYLKREGVTRDGKKASMVDAETDRADDFGRWSASAASPHYEARSLEKLPV